MGRFILAATFVFSQVAAAAAEATAELPKPSSNLYLESMLVGTIQRTGGFVDLRMRYRKTMYSSEHEAFFGNFIGAGLIEQATPIFSQTGAYVEVQPASFFRLTGAYELVGYFGTFNTMRTASNCEGVKFMTAEDQSCAFPLSGSTAPGRADYGHRAWVEALSQGRLGRFVASNNFTAERWWFRDDWAAGRSASFWVNELFALPQKKDDTVLTNTAMVMFEALRDQGGSSPHVMVGAMSSLAYAVGTDYTMHRVGPVGVLHIPEWKGMRDLAAVLMVQFYTHDRYAKGPLPFIGLALSVSTPNFMSGVK